MQEEFCSREQQMCPWGLVLVGTAGLGHFGVTQSLHEAFAPVGRVGMCKGQRRGALGGQSLSISIQEFLPPCRVWRLLAHLWCWEGCPRPQSHC